MVESSAPVLTALVVNGLFTPRIAASLGLAYAVGRVVYMVGYQTKKGADGRTPGAIIASLSSLSLFLLAFYNGYSITKL
jgi:glutathione S-transferase